MTLDSINSINSINSHYTIRPWTASLKDAEVFKDILAITTPYIPQSSTKNTLTRINQLTNSHLEGAGLVMHNDKPMAAYILAFNPEKPSIVRIDGGVLPAFTKQGIGSRLLKYCIQIAKEQGANQLRSMWFTSNTQTSRFMQKNQFIVKDQIFWSELNLLLPIPKVLHAKAKELSQDSSLKLITGRDFEKVKNWDYLWWNYQMQVLQDIPSTIPIQPISFERWRNFLNPPFLNRDHALIVMNKNSMIALMCLGNLQEDFINIDHTSVARGYRRRGISTLLKCKAIELAKRWGAKRLKTQNHEGNPMYKLNQDFGFKYTNTHMDGIKEI
jgi:GNAT superfamily N-acetyltransferase